MWYRHLIALLPAALIICACSDAPTFCGEPELELGVEADLSGWRDDADRLLAEAPPDSVLHIIVLLHPQAKQAFVDWAVATGGGFGYAPTVVPPDSSHLAKPGDRDRGGVPQTVPGVMIRYEFSAMSAYSVYMPVWALEGLKERDGVTGVELGLGEGFLPQC